MSEKIKQIPYPPESASDKIGRLLNEVMGRIDIIEFNEKMVAFARKIRVNHPDYQQYRCYHKLIGSTLPEDAQNTIEEDFKGEDSVAGFLEKLLKKGTVDRPSD